MLCPVITNVFTRLLSYDIFGYWRLFWKRRSVAFIHQDAGTLTDQTELVEIAPLLMLVVAPRLVAGRAALLLRSPAAQRLGSLPSITSFSSARPPLAMLAIRQLATLPAAGIRRPAVASRLSRVRMTSTKAEAGGSSRREELAEKSKAHVGRLKDLWNKYGIVAIGTYLTMYGAVLGSIYVAIDQGWVKTKKTTKGSAAAENEEFNLVTTTNKCVCLVEFIWICRGCC